MAPISNAPPEILQKIFRRCIHSQDARIRPFSPSEAPLLLCSVCTLWRIIAIATPQLWAQLFVSIAEETNKAQPSPQLIEAWIARSGCQPLTLVLQNFGQRSSGADSINKVLEMFLPHLHRWRNVTFILPNHPFPTPLTSLGLPSTSGASQLQIAKLEFRSDTGVHATDAPQVSGLSRLLKSSSQLHTLYWRNDLQFLDVNWVQLTVLDLVPVWRPMSQIIQIMQKAPKLRSLSVFISEACDVVDPLVLLNLAILWIGTEVDINPLFQRLALPSLQNINVFCANLVPSIPQTDVVNCVVRSGSRVQVGIFKSLRIPEADLITFLRSSPSLLLFEISNDGVPTITDDILGLLTAGDTPYLCPNLRIIRFLESSVSATDGLLADMVESRRKATPSNPEASLSRVVVDFSATDLPRHAEDIRRLRDLDDEAAFRAWINQPETA
ncbi:hypothetical protein DFH07DRAFT_1055194 [Mycena maculata]|uniref:F-box domain-containing protein n=1 Tax=Mycena maculata TaxID=230809 RepID=A0AAD7KD88_9AGAR|nr:hypothetical protein DFH07DRAFT_1055194 [Mycena maculata]